VKPAALRPVLLAWAVLACAAAAAAAEGEWVAPAAEKARPNPVPDSPEALRKGRALYQRHCTACHGVKGEGNGPASTDAANLTDPAVQERLTDGEIFWKIGSGRKKEDEVAMPAFARQIREQDRWKLVRFVRSLAAPAPSSLKSP